VVVPALAASFTPLSSNAYRLTVKTLALLLPTEVVTRTLTLPKAASAGTLHLMRVLLHET
jgi:hypothetical protein